MAGYHAAAVTKCDSRADFGDCPGCGYSAVGESFDACPCCDYSAAIGSPFDACPCRAFRESSRLL